MKHVARKLGVVVVLVGAAAGGLGSVGIAWRGHVAESRWGEALGAARAVEARLDARLDERLALWGETAEERAEPHYDRALALVAGWDVDTLFSAAAAEGDAARRARDAFVAEGTPGAEALEALHRGAHAAQATWSVDWSRGFAVVPRKLLVARKLALLCEMKADALLEDGRELEAVGVLLDLLQLAGDLSHGPLLIEEMIGLALLSPDVLVEGVADGSWLVLSEEADRRLRSGVSALDRRLGWKVRSFEGELVLSARGLENALQGEESDWRGLYPEWERGGLGFSQVRLWSAEHLESMLELVARFDRAFAAGPEDLFEEIERFPEHFEGLENPVSAIALPKLDSAYSARLFSLGRFRLLAHAIGGADPPEDPWLAEYLRVDETDEGTRLWLDHEAFGKLEVRAARRGGAR